MPGAVAFRIGKSYLNGDFLPMDKQKAKEWFSYGMVVGDTLLCFSLPYVFC